MQELTLTWEQIDEKDICSEEFWEYFGTFLSMKAVDKSGDILARDTATQYLSGCKESVRKLYPDNPLWNREKEWYTPLRKNLEKAIERRNNLNGVAHQEKSERIGRSLLTNINKHYFRKGDIESIKRIFILLITWLAIGRAGECAKTSWNNIRWDFDLQCMSFLWVEMKTSSQQEMLFFCDKNECEMDV
jgi:hypothetical protein